MKNSYFILLLSLLINSYQLNAQLLFNEFCADNESILMDEDGDYPDWIELYNAGDQPINLAGYAISDKPDNLSKWLLPNINLAAKGYLLVFASDKDRSNGELHTNFKLSKDGEQMRLTQPNGDIVDQIDLPALDSDNSFGRLTDGAGEWVYFLTPTPQASNNGSPSFGFAAAPTFDLPTFFHNHSINLSINCTDPDCEIYYTIDGKVPDRNARKYIGPINIDTTTAIRAVAYADGLLSSPISTRTYFINDNHTLPVIALTTAPDNLWDWERGIFELGPNAEPEFPFWGANFWEETEIPIHLEFFGKSQELLVEYPLGARTHGGRAARVLPNKPLRLMAKKEFGTALMEHAFFEEKNITQFERLLLRNASGDAEGAYMRDAFLHRYFINEGLNLDVLAHRPVIVYINGIYWGVMNLRERVDKHYLRYNHGVDPDLVEILEEEDMIVEGDFSIFDSMQHFVETNDLRIEANFKKAETMFDVEQMADYFIVQTALNNFDWPTNNIKYWRERKDSSRWRYLLFDLDVTMGRHIWTTAQANSFASKMKKDTLRMVSVIRELLDNEGYHNYFINRYADLLNTTFESERFKAEIWRSRDELDPEMAWHYGLWGGNYEEWKSDKIQELIDFANQRPFYARSYVQDFFGLEGQVLLQLNTFPADAGIIHLNTITPEALPWEGHYYKGIPVDLEVETQAGYVFSHWELSNHTAPDSIPSIRYTFRSDAEVTAVFKRIGADPSVFVTPNPVSSELSVAFNLEQATTVHVELYDYTGRLLYTMPEELLAIGTKVKTINMNGVADGLYILRIKMGEFVETMKIVRGS